MSSSAPYYSINTNIANNNPTIGNGNIPTSKVDIAVNGLIQLISSTSKSLFSHIQNCLQENPSICPKTSYSDFELPAASHSEMRRINIPYELIKKDLEWQDQYSLKLEYKITLLNPKDPIESLLYDLSMRVSELGFPCDKIELRFEKGCMDCKHESWHLDSPAVKYGITTCYSSHPSWSTRVVAHSHANELFKSMNSINIPTDNKTKAQIEAVSQPATFGFFYHAQKVLHRGPRKEDLQDRPITPKDYRLFIRLSRDKILDLQPIKD